MSPYRVSASIAQLDRATDYESVGFRFESGYWLGKEKSDERAEEVVFVRMGECTN